MRSLDRRLGDIDDWDPFVRIAEMHTALVYRISQ